MTAILYLLTQLSQGKKSYKPFILLTFLPDYMDQENQESNIVLRFFKEYQIAASRF